MTIFNSYVSLPEGNYTQKVYKVFSRYSLFTNIGGYGYLQNLHEANHLKHPSKMLNKIMPGSSPCVREICIYIYV